jgi:hypothetical protein
MDLFFWLVPIHNMRSPMIPFTLTIPSSYLLGYYNYPSMTKNEKKSWKIGFLTSASISLPSTQNAYHGPKNNIQPSQDITHNALHPMTPHKWPTGYHSPSSMTKNDIKWLINKFFQHCINNLLSHTQMGIIGQQTLFRYPMHHPWPPPYPHDSSQLPYRPPQPLICD